MRIYEVFMKDPASCQRYIMLSVFIDGELRLQEVNDLHEGSQIVKLRLELNTDSQPLSL